MDSLDWDEGHVYDLEKIVGKKLENGCLFYHVKWLGRPESEITWESLLSLMDHLEDVDEYEDSIRETHPHHKSNPRKRALNSKPPNQAKGKKHKGLEKDEVKTGSSDPSTSTPQMCDDQPSSEMEETKNGKVGEIFLLEKILEKKTENDRHFYLVKRLGYNNSCETTWEPLESFKVCPQIIKMFKRKLKEMEEQGRVKGQQEDRQRELMRKTVERVKREIFASSKPLSLTLSSSSDLNERPDKLFFVSTSSCN